MAAVETFTGSSTSTLELLVFGSTDLTAGDELVVGTTTFEEVVSISTAVEEGKAAVVELAATIELLRSW